MEDSGAIGDTENDVSKNEAISSSSSGNADAIEDQTHRFAPKITDQEIKDYAFKIWQLNAPFKRVDRRRKPPLEIKFDKNLTKNNFLDIAIPPYNPFFQRNRNPQGHNQYGPRANGNNDALMQLIENQVNVNNPVQGQPPAPEILGIEQHMNDYHVLPQQPQQPANDYNWHRLVQDHRRARYNDFIAEHQQIAHNANNELVNRFATTRNAMLDYNILSVKQPKTREDLKKISELSKFLDEEKLNLNKETKGFNYSTLDEMAKSMDYYNGNPFVVIKPKDIKQNEFDDKKEHLNTLMDFANTSYTSETISSEINNPPNDMGISLNYNKALDTDGIGELESETHKLATSINKKTINESVIPLAIANLVNKMQSTNLNLYEKESYRRYLEQLTKNRYAQKDESLDLINIPHETQQPTTTQVLEDNKVAMQNDLDKGVANIVAPVPETNKVEEGKEVSVPVEVPQQSSSNPDVQNINKKETLLTYLDRFMGPIDHNVLPKDANSEVFKDITNLKNGIITADDLFSKYKISDENPDKLKDLFKQFNKEVTVKPTEVENLTNQTVENIMPTIIPAINATLENSTLPNGTSSDFKKEAVKTFASVENSMSDPGYFQTYILPLFSKIADLFHFVGSGLFKFGLTSYDIAKFLLGPTFASAPNKDLSRKNDFGILNNLASKDWSLEKSFLEKTADLAGNIGTELGESSIDFLNRDWEWEKHLFNKTSHFANNALSHLLGSAQDAFNKKHRKNYQLLKPLSEGIMKYFNTKFNEVVKDENTAKDVELFVNNMKNNFGELKTMQTPNHEIVAKFAMKAKEVNEAIKELDNKIGPNPSKNWEDIKAILTPFTEDAMRLYEKSSSEFKELESQEPSLENQKNLEQIDYFGPFETASSYELMGLKQNNEPKTEMEAVEQQSDVAQVESTKPNGVFPAIGESNIEDSKDFASKYAGVDWKELNLKLKEVKKEYPELSSYFFQILSSAISSIASFLTGFVAWTFQGRTTTGNPNNHGSGRHGGSFWDKISTAAKHQSTFGGARKAGSFWDKLATVAQHQHDPIGGYIHKCIIHSHLKNYPPLPVTKDNLEKKPTLKCENCGSPENLMVHSKDPKDITCANCLDNFGGTSKGFGVRKHKLDIIKIEESKEPIHLEHEANKRHNQLMDSIKLPELVKLKWDEFQKTIPKGGSYYLDRANKDYHNPNISEETKKKRLATLIGLHQSDKRNMSNNHKANLASLISDVIKDDKPINPTSNDFKDFNSIHNLLKTGTGWLRHYEI